MTVVPFSFIFPARNSTKFFEELPMFEPNNAVPVEVIFSTFFRAWVFHFKNNASKEISNYNICFHFGNVWKFQWNIPLKDSLPSPPRLKTPTFCRSLSLYIYRVHCFLLVTEFFARLTFYGGGGGGDRTQDLTSKSTTRWSEIVQYTIIKKPFSKHCKENEQRC